MKKTIILSIAACIMLSSCATIFSGTRQEVSFTSSVPSVVYIKEEAIGSTPITTKIKRKTKKVEFRSEGFETNTQTLKKGINGWYWLDIASILLGYGVIPTAIDLIDGAAWTVPNSVYGDMKKK